MGIERIFKKTVGERAAHPWRRFSPFDMVHRRHAQVFATEKAAVLDRGGVKKAPMERTLAQLRRGGVWHRLILGATLLSGSPFFFWGGPGYYSSRSFQAAWDLGHLLYFLLFTLWVHDLRRKGRNPGSPFSSFLVLFALVLVLGSAVELLQLFVIGRTPDIDDVLRNQLGCLTAFAFCIRPQIFRIRWQQRILQAGVSVLLACSAWPLSRALFDEGMALRQFPVLSDFETPFERYRWNYAGQLRVENGHVRHGRQAARVQLSTEKYSGIALFHFPGDWRGYRALRFSVYNPDAAPLVLNSRVHDNYHRKHGMEYHDRFNQVFTLAQGWNDLVIPLDKVRNAPRDRAMDMEHIEGFGLFVVRQPRPLVLYLDYVYLDR